MNTKRSDSILQENTWCWMYTVVFFTWTAFCISTATFLISNSINDTHSSFIQFSNAYAEHLQDKTGNNQIILHGFSALAGALGSARIQETSPYANQMRAQYPYILSMNIAKAGPPQELINHAKNSANSLAQLERKSANMQSVFHPAALLLPSKSESGTANGIDSLSVDILRPSLPVSSDKQQTITSHPYRLENGNTVFASFFPVPHRPSLHNKNGLQSGGQYTAYLVVDADSMAAADNVSPPENLQLLVYHRDFKPEDPSGVLVQHKQTMHSAVEKFLFPNFQLHKDIGASFKLRVEKQLGWADLNLTLLSMFALVTLISSIMLGYGIRTHHLKRMADKQNKNELWFMANHDVLTQLPNRNLFMDRMEQAIARAQRQGVNFGILYIDLNGFKQINDTYGHDTGDKLLRHIAAKLQGCLRAEDSIARLGGDEFVVLLEGVNDAKVMESAAQKIRHSLSNPFAVNRYQLGISASIGMAAFPIHGKNPEDLLKHADARMYAEKYTVHARLA